MTYLNLTIHTHIYIFAFADDVTIQVTGRPNTLIPKAQTLLNRLTHYEDPWQIKTNPTKTKFTIFGASDQVIQNEGLYHITYNDTPIPQRTKLTPSPTTKFLGTILDKRLRFIKHTTYSINKARSAERLQLRFSNTSLKMKLNIYKTLTLPHLTYSPLTFALSSKRQ